MAYFCFLLGFEWCTNRLRFLIVVEKTLNIPLRWWIRSFTCLTLAFQHGYCYNDSLLTSTFSSNRLHKVHLIEKNTVFLSPNSDHREQDDVSEPRHHLRPQPAPQAEELGQGVQRPELGPGRGEHRRHRRAAEDDRQLPDPLHGQSFSMCLSPLSSFSPHH